jgi:hypothetical protein
MLRGEQHWRNFTSTWHLRQSAVGAIAFHSLFWLVEDAIACGEFR